MTSIYSVAFGGADDELLDTLALAHGPGDVPFGAGFLSWPGHDAEALQACWETFAEALRKLHALDSRERHWCEFYDEAALPPGMDLQDAAVQLAAQEAEDARRVLVHGNGGGK